MSEPGQIFLSRKWDHNGPTMTLHYSLGRKKKGKAAIMLFLGERSIDPKADDEMMTVIDGALFDLGYKRFRPRK